MKKQIDTEDNKNRKKKRKKSRRVLKVVLFIVLITLILVGSVFAYKVYKNGGGLSGLLATTMGHDEETLKNLDKIDILIMGESGVDDYKLADSIMIASYDPKTQEASLMSIPRDTYVGKKNRKTASQNYLASYKINTVYRSGTKIDEAIERINETTGLELKNYVILNTAALSQLVDAIGGVTFDVPMDMIYDDTTQNLHINLKAGEQLINGDKAEQLLRFRHNNDGSTYPSEYGQQDLGRMRTQREFIMATMKQTLKPQNLLKLKEIVDIIFNNLKTNMDINTVKDYIPYAVKFNAENLKTGMLPGDVEMCNGVSIYVCDQKKAKELIDELFPKKIVENKEGTNTIDNTTNNEGSKTSQIKIEVLNGSNTKSNLSTVVKELEAKGYQVVKEGNTTTTSKSTIINRTNKSSEIEKEIKSVIGTGTVTSGSDNANVDFTVIIGKDY